MRVRLFFGVAVVVRSLIPTVHGAVFCIPLIWVWPGYCLCKYCRCDLDHGCQLRVP